MLGRSPGEYAGVGYVFAKDDPYVGIDFDGCLVGGQVAEWAAPSLAALDGCYMEISPSGTGVKAWVRGKLPGSGGKRTIGGGDHTAIEVYSRARFFCVTGAAFGSPCEVIPDRQETIDVLYGWVKAPKSSPAPTAAAGPHEWTLPVISEGPPAATIEERAARYLDKCEPAIQGQGGSDATLWAAMIGPGFDLSPEATFRLLWEHYNARCVPPWSEKDLRRKVSEAFKRETRRGYHLDRDAVGPGKAPGASAVKAAGSGADSRTVVVITEKEFEATNAAAAALVDAKNLYQRRGRLVKIQRDTPPSGERSKIKRPGGGPRVVELSRAQLRDVLTSVANCVREKTDRNGDKSLMPVHPPDWLVDALMGRGDWPGVPPLEGIVETPTIRPDGSLLDAPGYDESTGYWLEPSGEFPSIPDAPTIEDARKAVDALLEVVQDFPFADTASSIAWLSALLTALARPAIEGPTPLFLISSNTAGCGKTKLYETIAFLATGRMVPVASYPKGDEEMQKLILATALAGDALLAFDNVPSGGRVGSAPLDQALTADAVTGRILGKSEMTGRIPFRTVIFATGNNLSVKSDARRRTVPVWMESNEERPEERQDFKIADLSAFVKAERGRLVMAALTILRAYIVAGRPARRLKAMDYPGWSGLVRAALHWATQVDPAETRGRLDDGDEESSELETLLDGWGRLCTSRRVDALSAAEALDALNAPGSGVAWSAADDFTALRELFASWGDGNKLPSSKVLGQRLNKFRGRVKGNQKIDLKTIKGARRWFVRAS